MDCDLRKLVKQELAALLRMVDNHRGAFSELKYNSLLDIFDEPAMRESGIDRPQAEAVFMARRLQQAMPLTAAMSATEESSLNNIIQDVGRWKDQTGYLYHHDTDSHGRETPNVADVKFIGSIVRDRFVNYGLKDVSFNRDNGYLTWRGNEFFDKISLRLTFDIRKHYNWSMRFSFGVFSRDGYGICTVSDTEAFGKVIYAVLQLKVYREFEYCDTGKSDFSRLRNYLDIMEYTLEGIRSWPL